MIDEIEDDFDFNAPVELTEVFRVPDDQNTMQEYGAKCMFGWEDVRMVEQYAFPDNWQIYPGEKFYVTLGFGNPKLFLGSYQEFRKYWNALRYNFPLFRKEGEE